MNIAGPSSLIHVIWAQNLQCGAFYSTPNISFWVDRWLSSPIWVAMHSFWGKKKEGVCPVKDLRLKPHLEVFGWANSEGSFAFSLSFFQNWTETCFFWFQNCLQSDSPLRPGQHHISRLSPFFHFATLEKVFIRSARSIWRVNLSSGFQFQSILVDQTHSIHLISTGSACCVKY